MADSPERTSCLSAEPHENNITDPLLHFLGCIKISKRHDFLEENFPGWKEEAGEYHKDPSSQHLPKAANQLAIHWATRIQNEMRRIALLRHTLSMDNRDKHLVQEMGESGEIWRGENKLNRGANSNTGPDFPRSTEEYVPEKDALVLVIQFQNSKGFTDPDQRLSGEFPNQTTTIDKLLDESNPEENLLYKDRESDSNHIKYFHIPSNNMTWVEEAIARYHVGRKSNSFKKSNDIVIDMQCLHWEAPRTQEQLVREIDKIIQSSRVQPERVVENAMPNKTKWNRYNRNALGRYLLAAAHLYQGMKTYRDGTLLYEYYLKQSAVYTSRTLEKASSSLFKSIKKTNASGAIQKGTATTSDTFHRYDEDTKDLLEHKGLSNEKMFQVIMEDQLRVWVLNGKSLITYFSRRYGTDTQDSLEVPKSISTYLEQISTDKAQIRTVFELALIVFNKYIEIPFKGGRLSNTQPRTGNTFFYEELDIVLNILNAQEDVVRSFAEEAERVLDPDGSFCAIFVRTALAKKDPLELGKGYGDYRSFKLRASECRETIESQRKEINLLREDAINTGDKLQHLLLMKQQQASISSSWNAGYIERSKAITSIRGLSVLFFAVLLLPSRGPIDTLFMGVDDYFVDYNIGNYIGYSFRIFWQLFEIFLISTIIVLFKRLFASKLEQMTHNFRSLRTSINSGIHERWASIAKETESFTKGFKRVFVNSVQSLYIGAKGRFMQFEGHKGRPSNAGSTPYSNLITITTRPQSLPVFVDRVFDLIMPMWEPPVPDGKKRVKWTCRCGTPLFDDFTELKPRAIENLEAELRGLGRTSGSGALKQLGELVVAAFKTWIVLPFVQKNYQNPWPASILLPTHTTNAQTASAIHQTGNNLYLLLCVDRGEFETKLHQKIINGLSNDRGIFQSLLREYHDYRKFRTWFTLRGISQLSLTRFTVDLGSFTEVHKHIDTCNPSCVCLPPEPKIDIEYRCRPAPKTDLGYVPAIGPARLTHYFRNPDCARNTQTTIYAQLPKRICGELLASDVTEELGWGIHFQEGWHWRTIFVIVIGFLFSFSLAFGIAWSVSKSDIRGAFAISGFVIASGSMLLGCLALRS